MFKRFAFALLGCIVGLASFAQSTPAAPIMLLARSGSSSGGGSETFTSIWCVSDQKLAKVPWHASAFPLSCPTLPTTSSSTTCTSAATCTTALASNAVQATVTSGYTGTTTIGGDDTRLIVPSGINIGPVVIGSSGPCMDGAVTRVQISSTATPDPTLSGSANGGRVGQIRIMNCPVSHVTIAGLHLNGETNGDVSLEGVGQCMRPDGGDHVLMLWVQARCGGYAWIGGGTGDFIWNHVSFTSSDATTASVGFTEGWNIRSGDAGPLSIFDADLRTTSYQVLRIHENRSGTWTDDYLAVVDSLLMNSAEARISTGWSDSDGAGTPNTGDGPGTAVAYVGNKIYAYSTGGICTVGNLDYDAPLSYTTNNQFFILGSADYSQSTIDAEQAAAPSGVHTDSGNTFGPWLSMPAWEGAGDPTSISMPAGLVMGNTTGRGGAGCTGVPL